MNYLSVQFAVFLVAAVLGFHLCPRRYRALFLLLASYAFYVLSSPLATLGILVATAFAFLFGFLSRPAPETNGSGRKVQRAMAAAVTLLVLYLSLFKVLNSAAFGSRFILPLGISYYTFKLISYIIDIYWGTIEPERN